MCRPDEQHCQQQLAARPQDNVLRKIRRHRHQSTESEDLCLPPHVSTSVSVHTCRWIPPHCRQAGLCWWGRASCLVGLMLVALCFVLYPLSYHLFVILCFRQEGLLLSISDRPEQYWIIRTNLGLSSLHPTPSTPRKTSDIRHGL